jgi:predicted MFS family arabinose efflux permease
MLPATNKTTKNTPAMPSAASLWRNRDYLLLWGGQAVSTVGSQLSLLAFPLLVLSLTHSPAQAGLIGALRELPYLLLGLPAGALVDRWDRKRVMVLCDIGRTLALGSIPLALLLGHLTLVQLYLVSLIEGALFIFFNLSVTACLPQVVAKEQLPAAVAQDQAANATSQLFGPSLGGLCYTLGRMVPFLADTISYGVSVLSLLFIKTAFQEERTAGPRSLRAEVLEGLVWLWRQPLVRFLALLSGIFNLTGAGYTLIVIVLAQRLHASSFAIGLILAGTGVGNILGTLVTPTIQKRFNFRQVMIGSTWVLALTWPLFVFTPTVFLLGVVTALSFVAVPALSVAQVSYRLSVVPDHLQGRVNAPFRIISWGCLPLGLALAGAMLQSFGPVATVWITFVPQLALAVAVSLNRSMKEQPQ